MTNNKMPVGMQVWKKIINIHSSGSIRKEPIVETLKRLDIVNDVVEIEDNYSLRKFIVIILTTTMGMVRFKICYTATTVQKVQNLNKLAAKATRCLAMPNDQRYRLEVNPFIHIVSFVNAESAFLISQIVIEQMGLNGYIDQYCSRIHSKCLSYIHFP